MILWIIVLAIIALFIWYLWDSSIGHRTNKLDDLSDVYYRFSLVFISQQIFEEKRNIQEQKKMLLRLLEMTSKHSRLESEYRENKTALFELAQDWYRYCSVFENLARVPMDITYGDEYIAEKTDKTRIENPHILAEIEKKFEKKLTE